MVLKINNMRFRISKVSKITELKGNKEMSNNAHLFLF